MTSHIRTDQVYASVHPSGQERIRVVSYTGGGTAEVVDAATGGRARRVHARVLRTSDRKEDGQLYVSGYVLVKDPEPEPQEPELADAINRVVIRELAAHTGQTISADTAAQVAATILGGRRFRSPLTYVVAAIDQAVREGDLGRLGVDLDVPSPRPEPQARVAPQTFRTRHRTVTAWQWDGVSEATLQALVGVQNAWLLDAEDQRMLEQPEGSARVLADGERLTAHAGNWVIRHDDGRVEVMPSHEFGDCYELATEDLVPQSAVDAVLESWRAAYEQGREDYKPDPSHAGVIRESLVTAWPHLYGTFLDAQADEAQHDMETDAMASAMPGFDWAEDERQAEAHLDAIDEADLAEAAAEYDETFADSLDDDH
ncbi:hypothetical protein [Nocardiopsis dassonvillei]|uniref:hypothetical protein n=1 Tax=Nocardiopsis dassonvillei TaxID=2014 RepID=UPI003628ACC7